MGFTDTLFGEPDKEKIQTVPSFEESEKARKKLLEIAQGDVRDVPLREIAPLQPAAPESELARSTATELAQPVDIFSLPEVQGIIQEVTAKGDLLANRIGRSLQKAGSFASTAGRDVLGRAVTDVQKSLTASLAPFAESERRRRTSLIPILERLGLTQEERPRLIEQAGLDALFSQETIESKQILNEVVPILQFLAGLQQQGTVIKEEGRMGLVEQASILGPFLSSVIGGGKTGGN